MKIVNVSGLPREYKNGSFIYEFPYPSELGTEVPDELGQGLIKTGNFKEFGKKEKPINDNDDYFKELVNLPKIGIKTAKDIIKVYPSKEKLKEAISNKIALPFDDDVEKILLEYYGGKIDG